MCFAGNPLYSGNWKGYLFAGGNDGDKKRGLPVSLYIIDDNDDGDLVGEMSITYRYQSDLYRAKYKMSGQIDYENRTMFLQQEELIYYDLLPKGLKWCFGSGTFEMLRNPYKKKNYIDGYMTTNCGDEKLRMVLIKK